MSDNQTVRIIPFGGLGEIGKNMMAIEYNNDVVIIDCGLQFPNSETPGIDFILADWSYLNQVRSKIRGLVLTHGHEDHIGGVSYFIKEFDVPIYGSPLTLGLVRYKIEDNKIFFRNELITVAPRQQVKMGELTIEFIRVNHSIADAYTVIIHSPIGVLIHTGDFKIDLTPVDKLHIDLPRLAELGEKGVLLLMSDSTNVERQGHSPSEKELGSLFDNYIKNCDGRLFIATFASNIIRIQQILDVAHALEKKVVIVGRSMIRITQIAEELGYLTFPEDVRLDITEINKYPKQKIIVLVTGSQGEPMSVLTHLSRKTHKVLSLEEGDTVMISAGIIPGNEETVFNVINNLFRQSANVIYKNLEDVHISGHATANDLKLILTLTKPKFFLPIHGAYRHLVLHSRIGVEMGVPKENILIVEDGEILELTPKSFKSIEKIPSKLVVVDGKGIGDISTSVLKDRQYLAENGVINIIAMYQSRGQNIDVQIEIFSRGFIRDYNPHEVNTGEMDPDRILEGPKDQIRKTIIKGVKENLTQDQIKSQIKNYVRQYFYQQTERRPVMFMYLTNCDSLFN